MRINDIIQAADLLPRLHQLLELSAKKILSIEKDWDAAQGTPVYTVKGRYATRGWTEWTQGFQYGSAALQFDATDDETFLRLARENTVARMAAHVSHIGVHDHGFNNVSTYGNLRRLMREGRIAHNEWEQHFHELALKLSGAVQAARWTVIQDGSGFVHSFNGAHSLFVDTIRSMRSLALAHQLGHVLMTENDHAVSLLDRLLQHCHNTARFSVYYGEDRDVYDIRGRTVHECVFNIRDGRFRCPSTQQGYSPFSTWTRGLAWALTGFAEQLEFLAVLPGAELEPFGGRENVLKAFERPARATADYYLAHTPTDGIPYWDNGAPGLAHLGDIFGRPADPYNEHEPVDSSAAAIAAQGLIRLGRYLGDQDGARYLAAGLTVAHHLFDDPYLSRDDAHQGLILHSIYHRPNGWDHIPEGGKIPHGESSMWGDYHARELALLILRLAQDKPYLVFFDVTT